MIRVDRCKLDLIMMPMIHKCVQKYSSEQSRCKSQAMNMSP